MLDHVDDFTRQSPTYNLVLNKVKCKELYTAISIKVVPKKREKVEYERERLNLSRKTSFIPEYITIHRFSTKFKIRSCFLININRD